MNASERRERLRQETGRALQRLGELQAGLRRRGKEPPRAGDLYALPAAAAFPVEWLVVESAGRAGRVLVVPADTNPLVGSADVEVPAGSVGGPLSLRCRFGEAVDAEVLATGKRTGLVDRRFVEQVLRKRRALAAAERTGEPAGSALDRETDEESAYREWIEEVVGPARDALSRRAAVRDRDRPGSAARSTRLAAALAALFCLAAAGLSIWVAALRREVARLSSPSVEVALREVSFGERTRGAAQVEEIESASYLVLELVLGGDLPVYERYQLEIADGAGTPLWTSPAFGGGPYREVPVVVPRRRLPVAGLVRLRLYGVAASGTRLLEQQVVALKPSQS
jgi:hypothetical protein